MLPFLVFLIVSGVVVGGYAAFQYLPGMRAERRLGQRLNELSLDARESEDGADESIVRHADQGPLPTVDRLAARTSAGSWLLRLIEQSGVRTTPSTIVAVALMLGVGLFFVFGLIHQPILAPIAAVAGGFLPFGWLMRCRTVRLKKFEEQFPEVLDLLSRAIRAGHAFPTALGMAADELPAPAGAEFRKTFDQQNFGLPLRDALEDLATRVNLLDVRFFVTAVTIQRETGGNLSEILDNLARVVRERFKIQRQIRIHTAHGRFTGFVLLAVPAFLAITLTILNGEFMSPLFHEHLGQLMLGGAIVLQVIGFFWIKQVIKIEV